MTVAAAALESTYLYKLSSFTGPLPLEWVAMANDDLRNETYICNPAERSVVIFNEQGMEVFRFGEDHRFGLMSDVAVLEDGGILVLSADAEGRAMLVRCTYRGEIKSQWAVPVPAGMTAPFRPNRLLVRAGRLYLLDLSGMLVVEATPDGSIVASHDLGAVLGLSRAEVENTELGGVAIDQAGNFLFTVPTLFKAYRLGTDGKLESFGQPGSSPGRFGVIAGIATDRRGLIYVVDTLRCVVIAFDQSFVLVGEVGHRGTGPGGLIAPKELTLAADGKMYVTQMAKRGVNVYRVTPG